MPWYRLVGFLVTRFETQPSDKYQLLAACLVFWKYDAAIYIYIYILDSDTLNLVFKFRMRLS